MEAAPHVQPEPEPAAVPRPGRWLWTAVLPIVLFQFVGGTLSVSVLPGMQTAFFGDETYTVLGVSQGIQGIMMFLVSPSLGSLSDYLGRRPLMIVTQSIMALPTLALVLFPTDLWVYTGVGMITGAFTAYYYLAYAFITDVTGPGMRSTAMGVLSSMLGVSLLIGPPLGDWIEHHYGPANVFRVSLGIAVANVLYIAAAMPESAQYAKSSAGSQHGGEDAPLLGNSRGFLGPDAGEKAVARPARLSKCRGGKASEHGSQLGSVLDVREDTFAAVPFQPNVRSPASLDVSAPSAASQAGCGCHTGMWAKVNPFPRLRAMLRTRTSRLLAIVVFTSNLSEQALLTLVLPFLQRQFHFTDTELTWFAMTTGLANFIGQAAVMGPAVKWLGPRRFLQVALVFSFCHVTLYGVMDAGWMAFLATALAPGAYIISPAAAYCLSLTTPPKDMGAVQGSLVGVKNLGNGFGPLMFGVLLHVTIYNKSFPAAFKGSAFFLGSLCNLVGLGAACMLPRGLDAAAKPRHRRTSTAVEPAKFP